MKNIRLAVEYDGTDFFGWQRQSGSLPTLQGVLETRLCCILQENVRVVAAGRTDKGVHARRQVVNFMTGSDMAPERMVHALNCLLPVTVGVSDPQIVPHDFHARFSAKEREYRYFLLESHSALCQRFTGCSRGVLDIRLMQAAAASVCGNHDFRAFSREPADRSSCMCRVSECEWIGQEGGLVFRIRANRFLRSMVRYLVSAMIAVGKQRISPPDFSAILEAGNLQQALVPAEPNGLFLWEVLY
ncbi:MAG: tRNA pseudouridine(38-40) synthase TruA [Chlorobi bacterium]|nr:tRNA pseudouridine(38-40) synthase TruA [Chlorobiota bacterium]